MLVFIISISAALKYLPLYGKTELSTYYYSKLSLGTPPQEKNFLLELGSGLSTLTCSPCEGCGNHTSPYFSPQSSTTCEILSYSTNKNLRSSQKSTLNYSINYFDGSKISGYLIQETIFFSNSPNSPKEFQMILGCNFFENGRFLNHPPDGILGLGKPNNENYSIFESLIKAKSISEKSFSICLGYADGFIVFGGMDERFNISPVSWVKMSEVNNYVMRIDEISIGEGSLKALKASTEFMISSHSSISFFSEDIYKAIMNGFNSYCKQPGKCQGTKSELKDFAGLCYHSKQIPYESFPTIELLANGSTILWEPESYIIRIQGDTGLYCVGIGLSHHPKENNLGSNFLRLKQIFFDLENGKFGFSSSSCEHSEFISSTEKAHNSFSTHKNPDSNAIFYLICSIALVHIVFIGAYFKVRNSIKLQNNQIIVSY